MGECTREKESIESLYASLYLGSASAVTEVAYSLLSSRNTTLLM